MSIIRLAKNTLERFIYIRPSDAFLLAEFSVLTHAENPIMAIPVITSLLPGHGKTQTVRILAKLSMNGIHVKGPKVAAFRREVDKGECTILLDETDKWMFRVKASDEFALVLNCIFDQDDAVALISEQDAKTGKFSSMHMALSGRPVLIAGKHVLTKRALRGPQWDTVLDRTFPIYMEPYPDTWLAGHEIYKGNEGRYNPTLTIVNSHISEWMKKNKDAFVDCDPSMRLPGGRLLTMRDADKFRMMLHLADLDGQGDEARAIVETLLAGKEPDAKRFLLAAVKAIFEREDVTRMSAKLLAHHLATIEHPVAKKIGSTGILHDEDHLGAEQLRIKKGKVWVPWEPEKSVAGYKLEDILRAHQTFCKAEDDTFVANVLMGDEKRAKYPPKTEESEETNEINGLTPKKTEGHRKSPEESEEVHDMVQTATDGDDPLAALVDRWQGEVDALKAEIAAPMPDEIVEPTVKLARRVIGMSDTNLGRCF